jgi:hypothetical protein
VWFVGRGRGLLGRSRDRFDGKDILYISGELIFEAWAKHSGVFTTMICCCVWVVGMYSVAANTVLCHFSFASTLRLVTPPQPTSTYHSLKHPHTTSPNLCIPSTTPQIQSFLSKPSKTVLQKGAHTQHACRPKGRAQPMTREGQKGRRGANAPFNLFGTKKLG